MVPSESVDVEVNVHVSSVQSDVNDAVGATLGGSTTDTGPLVEPVSLSSSVTTSDTV